jgi:hypothetical protein
MLMAGAQRPSGQSWPESRRRPRAVPGQGRPRGLERRPSTIGLSPLVVSHCGSDRCTAIGYQRSPIGFRAPAIDGPTSRRPRTAPLTGGRRCHGDTDRADGADRGGSLLSGRAGLEMSKGNWEPPLGMPRSAKGSTLWASRATARPRHGAIRTIHPDPSNPHPAARGSLVERGVVRREPYRHDPRPTRDRD